MEVWVAIAAAGAGYVAKHWKNLAKDREYASEIPSENSKPVKAEAKPSVDHSCQYLRRFSRKKKLAPDTLSEKEVAEQSASAPEVASTSSCDGKNLNLDDYEDYRLLSLSGPFPKPSRNEDIAEVAEDVRLNHHLDEHFLPSIPERSMVEAGIFNSSPRHRSCLRSRQSKLQRIKPLTSMGSCLMAQFYKEDDVPSQALRPFFVTDGKKIINRQSNSFNFLDASSVNKLHKENCSADDEAILGIPPLPCVGSLAIPKFKDTTQRTLGRQRSSSSKVANAVNLHTLAGSSDGAYLFGLGVSIGLISSLLANNREFDKLNNVLKQTENLVQDLQDELQMRDSFSVKELAIEDNKTLETFDLSDDKSVPHVFSCNQNLDGSVENDGKEMSDEKEEVHSDSMSKIEEELVAELERLELNLTSSNLERRLSELAELDPDFVPDITEGDLRPGIFGRQSCAQAYADQDGSGTVTPRSVNYAVSPTELRLRLHELLETRLEERVKELESALERSQMKVQLMESDRKGSYRGFSESRPEGIIPFAMGEQNVVDQPVVINLSGEALGAYNEAYDVFSKINESEESDLASSGDKTRRSTSPLFDQNNGEEDGEEMRNNNNTGSPEMTLHEVRTSYEQNLLDVGYGTDESESEPDEMEKLLIQQIVEKTRRQSSSVSSSAKKTILSGY